MMQPSSREPLIIAPGESRSVAQAAGEAAGIALAPLEEREYPGGEFKLRPLETVCERRVFVVQSLAETPEAPMSHRLVRLLFLLQTLRDAGAAHVVAVIPYLAYARKDRRTKPQDPVYTRYVAQLIETAGTDRVVVLDVHNVSSLDNAFRIPIDHLTALPMMAAHFVRHLPTGKLAVAAPDIGGIKRAQAFRELLTHKTGKQVELLCIEKHRTGQSVAGGAVVGNASGRDVIVLDDMCASGATMLQAATALRAAGATSVHVAVTHTPVETGVAALAAADHITQIVVTDSVGHELAITTSDHNSKVRTLATGELLGNAMARIAAGVSLTPLASDWPLPRE